MKFFEDTTAQFNSVKHHGYYSVGEKNFLYRYNAYLHASEKHLDVTWHFNDEVYGTIDWSKPLDLDIRQIYKQRAQQLRDKYNYLILAYSGGPDSDNVLHSFIDNGIKLDEVWVDWPHGLMKKTKFKPSMSLDHRNLASEWMYTIQPKLDDLALYHPEIKIHISDTASSGVIEDNDDTFCIVGFRTSYQNIRRMRYICEYQHNLHDKGLKSALIVGIEKPLLTLTPQGMLTATFHDLPTVFKNDYTPMRHTTIEYFYWTPDHPFIVVNQCHDLIRYFQLHPKEFESLKEHMVTGIHSIDRSKNMDSQINKVCYPTWDNSFQTNKFIFAFESNQFNQLLLPFVRTEKFANVYYHRYFADTANMDPKLLFHEWQKHKARGSFKRYPIMSLDKFYEGVKNV
jgi:hypothetical protein